jgi:hypothetical protein
MTDYILKLLGLDMCADTVVGNEMLRGISGGQKKRVTTGEWLNKLGGLGCRMRGARCVVGLLGFRRRERSEVTAV